MHYEDHDPKAVAAQARKFPETEKVLRQFLSLESGNFVRREYRKGYDLAFGKGELHKLPQPMKCKHDGFVAESLEEAEWHEERCGHDLEADFEPVR